MKLQYYNIVGYMTVQPNLGTLFYRVSILYFPVLINLFFFGVRL